MTRPPKQWTLQVNGPVCAGQVAANIVGESLEEFTSWYGGSGAPFATSRVLEYLSRHGIIIAYHCNILYKQLDDGGKLIGYRVEAELNQPAFIVARVDGTPPDARHACFWDGERLWDPHFATPVEELERYDITSWTPLYFPDRAEFREPLTINRL